MIFQELNRKMQENDIFYEKELTLIGLISTSRPRKDILEDTKGLHKAAHLDLLPGGADRPAPTPPRLLPLQAASTASYDASQPYVKVGFIQGSWLIPQGYIKRPPDP
jgi:hypothetical protein